MTDDKKQADREHFEERAAIREFDGGMTRQQAEQAARIDVMKARQLAQKGGA